MLLALSPRRLSAIGGGVFSVLAAVDSTAKPLVVFGPVPVVRQAGAPAAEQFVFAHPPVVKPPFELVVQNGATDRQDRLSSAEIELNGVSILGPSSFNQNVDIVRVPVVLIARNELRVIVHGTPGGFLRVSIEGQIADDRVVTETAVDIGPTGGVVQLTDIAQLRIPPGAFALDNSSLAVASAEDTTRVWLAALTSDGMDYLSAVDLPDFTPLPSPKIRVATSRSPQEALTLIIHGIDPAAIGDRELTTIGRRKELSSEDGALVPSVALIGATGCEGGRSACVQLFTTQFGGNPLEPMVTVGAGTLPSGDRTYYLWRVDVSPSDSKLVVSPSDSLKVSGRFVFETNILFAPGSPLLSNNVTQNGHYFAVRRNGPHRAVDLQADSPTPVFAVLDAEVGRAFGPEPDPHPEFCKERKEWIKANLGHRVNLLHPKKGDNLQTTYAHLKPDSEVQYAGGPGLRTWAGQQIALSGSSGTCKPHLHFGLRLGKSRIDPEPLVKNDLKRYVSDTMHPVTLSLQLEKDAIGHLKLTELGFPTYPFDWDVPLAGLTPGSEYNLTLLVNSERFESTHNVRSWKLRVGHRLSVILTGPGVVTSLPAAIDCPTDPKACKAVFDPGPVTLTAAPAPGFKVQWGGDCSGTSDSVTLDMNGDRTCTAQFEPECPSPAPPVHGALEIGNSLQLDIASCARHAVYFPDHQDSWSWTQQSATAILGTSSSRNMVNAIAFCTFAIPDGVASMDIAFQGGTVAIDPGNTFPAASGGGLGVLLYEGCNSPLTGTTWGDYGISTFAKYFIQRPDWNRTLAPEVWTVPMTGGPRRITIGLLMSDAWENFPVSIGVSGIRLTPR